MIPVAAGPFQFSAIDVSRPTAHEYVGKVYRHFNVKSHAELMAYFLQRRPKR